MDASSVGWMGKVEKKLGKASAVVGTCHALKGRNRQLANNRR